MSFGKEFRNMRAVGGAPKITEEVVKEAEADASKAPEAPAQVDPDVEMFSQHIKAEPIETPAQAAPAAEIPPVIPPPKEVKKVKIKDKEFDSVEEAMAFAEAELIEAEKKEAYARGVTDSTKPKEEVKPAEKKKILKIAEKLFENPEEAFEELEAHFAEMADKRHEARDSQKSAEQVRQEKIKQETDNFYKNNADLADWQDEVNLVVQKNWNTLSKLAPEKIASETARMARDYVASVKVKALPKQELPSKTAQSASASNPTTTTAAQTTDKKVSFASQVRSTNKRTVMQDEA